MKKNIFISAKKRYGCGSGIFYLKNEKTFFDACKWHDIEYKKANMSRSQIDKKFLKIMLIACKGECFYCKIRACLFYLIVVVFGGLFYKGGLFHYKEKLKH